ncbi:MAG TPA: aminoglycoside phosphotransferase family protein [Burkholderiaceae bacterium]|nr:aminoglycoside phosphotransferase family protein [Burkholderiaceae bacterium]
MSAFVDLAGDRAALAAMLARHGLADGTRSPEPVPLTGGVSSSIFRIELPSGPVCVKQALPKLKVAKDWTAPVERVFAEVDWLRVAAGVVPRHVPAVIAVDRECGAFVMPFLDPAAHRNWRERLLDGEIDAGVAAALGGVLGRLHAASADRPELARRFAHDGAFFSLRLEPYLVESARQHPDLAVALIGLVHATQHVRRVLVHGDASPKNVLVGPDGPVLLDAECAWYGDPAFDLAFLSNHLLLKAVHRPARASAFVAALEAARGAYLARVTWEPPAEVERRTAALLPALLLARVDGKSPVDYLSEPARAQVRAAARAMLAAPPATIADVTRTLREGEG